MDFFGSGLVLRRPRVATFQDAEGGGAPPPRKTADINLSNILKLIPADVVAIYLAGKGLKDVILGIEWPVFLFWLCVLVCVVLRFLATRAAPGGVNILLIVVTVVAFFVWAHAVNDVGPVIASFHGSAAGFVAMLIGLFAPAVVPAQPEP